MELRECQKKSNGCPRTLARAIIWAEAENGTAHVADGQEEVN